MATINLFTYTKLHELIEKYYKSCLGSVYTFGSDNIGNITPRTKFLSVYAGHLVSQLLGLSVDGFEPSGNNHTINSKVNCVINCDDKDAVIHTERARGQHTIGNYSGDVQYIPNRHATNIGSLNETVNLLAVKETTVNIEVSHTVNNHNGFNYETTYEASCDMKEAQSIQPVLYKNSRVMLASFLVPQTIQGSFLAIKSVTYSQRTKKYRISFTEKVNGKPSIVLNQEQFNTMLFNNGMEVGLWRPNID